MLKKLLLSLLFIPTLHASAPAAPTLAEKQSREALAQLDIAVNLMNDLKAVLDQYRNEEISIQKTRQYATKVLNEYRSQATKSLLGVVQALHGLVAVAVKSRTPFLSRAGTQLAETFKGTDPEKIEAAIEKIKSAPGQYSVKDLQFAAAVAQKQGVEQGVSEIKEALEVKKQAHQAAVAESIKQDDEQEKWLYQRAYGGVKGAVGGARERFSRYWWGDQQGATK